MPPRRPNRILHAPSSRRPPEWAPRKWTLAGTSPPPERLEALMSTIVFLVAIAAALGVALVVYGLVTPQPAASGAGPNTRITYRSLADVREQLRRRFEPSGAPIWIAANEKGSSLARDLASADLDLRPYEFRMLQVTSAAILAVLGLLRFG